MRFLYILWMHMYDDMTDDKRIRWKHSIGIRQCSSPKEAVQTHRIALRRDMHRVFQYSNWVFVFIYFFNVLIRDLYNYSAIIEFIIIVMEIL